MHFPEIQGAEVCEEWLVNQVVVDTEVERMGTRLGWILVRDPVQATWNDFNRFVITLDSPLSMIFSLD